MLLIAESGSSKTQWRIVDKETRIAAETGGINPFFASEAFVLEELNNSELAHYKKEINKIIFYGSGCSHAERNNFLKTIFQGFFTEAKEIIVDHDMLAACIALFGKESGIACIIGTGSNSCVYDGKRITQNTPALGYVLGDEASGAYLGKELLKHYIYKTLPPEIQNYIWETYRLDKEDIFEAVYKQPLPNRYLASFAPIASQYRQNGFIQELLDRGLNEFVRYHIACYPEATKYPIGFVGSIAAVFQEELSNALKSHDLYIYKVDKSPIDALVAFYTS
jgi:N-acetylglucosamine kinase-like BadF-type ATPase